jgi:FkbM family methyltransferase
VKSAVWKLIEFYALKTPYHAGKWRIVEGAVNAFGIDSLHRGKVSTVVRRGLKWNLGTQCSLQRRLFYHGLFDRHEGRELLAAAKPGSTFFDIGAYFGYYAIQAAQLGAKVFAFEPVGRNFAQLQANIALNQSSVEAIRLALSDSNGEVSFEIPDASNGGRGHIATADTGAATETVTMTTLAEFAASRGVERIDAVKLDVEGAEVRVLRGGADILRKSKPVMLVELNPPCLARFGTSEAELLDTLRDLGFAIHRANGSGLVPYKGLHPGEGYTNIICTAAK